MYKSFPGKVILFGEYSIIAGSQALVAPLLHFCGQLHIPGTEVQSGNLHPSGSEAKESNQELRGFFEYLVRLPKEDAQSHDPDSAGLTRGPGKVNIDLDSLETDLERGLYFQSTIPVQYGAGSSAALVAAIYDAYSMAKIEKNCDAKELISLRSILSKLESYFHGNSSGIDPLCSFTGKALYIQKDQILPVSIPKTGKEIKLFLLDSGIRGETDTLVSDFNFRRNRDMDFARRINEELAVLVESGINEIIRVKEGKRFEKQNDLQEIFSKVSEWQLKHFTSMIPESVLTVWENGIKTRDYAIKLCGSGGGGFFLGYTEKWTKVKGILIRAGLKIIPLEL